MPFESYGYDETDWLVNYIQTDLYEPLKKLVRGSGWYIDLFFLYQKDLRGVFRLCIHTKRCKKMFFWYSNEYDLEELKKLFIEKFNLMKKLEARKLKSA